jgi:hypothetical protein
MTSWFGIGLKTFLALTGASASRVLVKYRSSASLPEIMSDLSSLLKSAMVGHDRSLSSGMHPTSGMSQRLSAREK